MNEQEFNEMYNEAIKKIAIGFYILDNCGDQLDYDAETLQSNKKMLCGILADGINLSITTIYVDASSINLSRDYITRLRTSGLLEELIQEMRLLTNQENKKLSN